MFTTISIGKRLYLVLGTIVLLGFTATLINYQQLRTIETRATSVARDRWPKTVVANKIIDNINANGKAVLALMFLSNTEEMKKTVARMSEASQELTGLYEQLDKTVTDEAGKALLGRIKEARAAYVGNRKKAVDLALNGQVEQAKALLISETIPLQKEYLKAIYALIETQGDAMTGAVTEIENTVARSQVLAVAISLVTLVAAVAATMLLTRSITHPLDNAVALAESVAAGRLDNRIEITTRDETGALLMALSRMQTALRETIGKANAVADQVTAAATELATAARQAAAGSQAQSQAIAATAATIEQLAVSIEHVSDNANDAATQASGAGQLAAEGSAAVEASTSHIILVGEGVDASAAHINELSKEVERIGSITVVINDVADQTNLLALNAAIEAARAGDAGRGFAVVADEVRKLAERTSNSVREINAMISGIQNETKTAVDSMLENRNMASAVVSSSAGATGSMVHLTYTTELIEKAIADLSDALREQRSATGDLAKSIESIAQMADENSTAIGVVAGAAHDLETTAVDLRKAVAVFNL